MTAARGARPVALFICMFVFTSSALRGLKMLVALGALHLGANTLQVGMLAAAFAVMPLFVSLPAGRISDRIGPRGPIFAGAAAMVCALLVPLWSLTIGGLFVSALMLGLGQIFIQVAVHNAIGHVSTADTRARNYASLSLGVSFAAFVAPPVVGATVDHFGFAAAFAVLAVDAALAAVPAMFLSGTAGAPAAAAEELPKSGSMALLAHAPLRRVLLMSGVAMSAVELYAFYLPIYGDTLGLSATAIGTILAFNALASLAVRVGTRQLLRRFDAMRLLAGSLFVAAASFALFPMFGNVPVLCAISFLLGLGLGMASPLTISQTYETSPAGRSGEALGMRVLVNKVVQIAVPLTFGSLGTLVGVTLVFWTNAALLFVAGALGRRRA